MEYPFLTSSYSALSFRLLGSCFEVSTSRTMILSCCCCSCQHHGYLMICVDAQVPPFVWKGKAFCQKSYKSACGVSITRILFV